MDKSSTTSQSQKSSTRRQVRMNTPTPSTKTMTPPTSQSMELPSISASQPPETSDGKMYLRILKDVAKKFKHTGRPSEVFTQLANQFREEEAFPSPMPLEISAEPNEPVETPATQPLKEPTLEHMTSPAGDSTEHVRDKEHNLEVEGGEEVNNQEEESGRERNDEEGGTAVRRPVEKDSTGTNRELADPEEETIQEPVGGQPVGGQPVEAE